MFGIGLPEMIVIFVVALIVVGPDKLPELARSLAKGVLELKRTLNEVRGNFTEEEEALHSVRDDLRKTAEDLRKKVMLTDEPDTRRLPAPSQPEPEAEADYQEITQQQGQTPSPPSLPLEDPHKNQSKETAETAPDAPPADALAEQQIPADPAEKNKAETLP